MKKIFFGLFFLPAQSGMCQVPADKPADIKVAVSSLELLKVILDYAEPFFRAEGVTVERVMRPSGAVHEVSIGKADVSFGAINQVLRSIRRGEAVKIIAILFPRIDTVAVSRFGPQEAGNIKTMALDSIRGESYLLMLPFLEYLKADPARIKSVVAKREAAEYAAFKKGDADIVVLSSRGMIDDARREGKYTFIPFKDAASQNKSKMLLVASDSALQNKSAQLDKFLAALYASLKSAASDKAKMTVFLKEKEGFSSKEADAFQAGLAASFAAIEITPDANFLEITSTILSKNPIPEYGDSGKGKKAKAFSEMIEPSYATKAKARIK